MSESDDVLEFHSHCGIPCGNTPRDDPGGRLLIVSASRRTKELSAVFSVVAKNLGTRSSYRLSHLLEELSEIIEAAGGGDDVALLDGLVDLTYVAKGWAVERGWDFDEAWRRVHASNMSKLGDDGLPVMREDGKVLKGPNFQPPNLADLVTQGGVTPDGGSRE